MIRNFEWASIYRVRIDSQNKHYEKPVLMRHWSSDALVLRAFGTYFNLSLIAENDVLRTLPTDTDDSTHVAVMLSSDIDDSIKRVVLADYGSVSVTSMLSRAVAI